MSNPIDDTNKQRTLNDYQAYLEEMRKVIFKEPDRLWLNFKLQDWIMFLNMQMQDPKTTVVVVPETVRDQIGRYGNYFYPKGVLQWPF